MKPSKNRIDKETGSDEFGQKKNDYHLKKKYLIFIILLR